MKRLLVVIAAALLAFWTMASANQFERQGTTLILNGEITQETLEDFIEITDENPDITLLIEEDVPGSGDDEAMIELAYMVRDMGLNTHLRSTSDINSGGVDLFLAGVERTMEKGAHIGVHSWSDGTNDAIHFPKDSPEHDMNRTYIEKMLGSDAFYWFTIHAAPASDIHSMTEQEIAKYGLLTQPIQ